MRFLLLLFVCLLTSTALFAQKILRGKLLSAEDKKPIGAASVYLSNTAIGTMSKEDGSFSLGPIPAGRYDLVVSSMGYATHTEMISADNLPDNLVITLGRKVVDLQQVIVEPYIKNGWKEWGDFFMQHLIGKTPNAKHCKLLNKQAVRFRLKKAPGRLEVITTDPLVIENKALGYTLTYDLVVFEFNFSLGMCTYQGYPLFKEMETSNEKTKAKWLNNRQATYEGSLMHFMRSVYRNQLQAEGFTVKKVWRRKQKNKAGFYEQLPAILFNQPLAGDSIAYSIDTTTVQLQFTDYLQVVYEAKKIPKAYVNTQPTMTINGMLPLTTKKPLTSEITTPNSGEGIQVLYNGHYYFTPNLITMQYWAWSEKLSNLLPLDYGNPQSTNAEVSYKPQRTSL